MSLTSAPVDIDAPPTNPSCGLGAGDGSQASQTMAYEQKKRDTKVKAWIHPCERATTTGADMGRSEECQLLTFASNSMRMSACVRAKASNK